MENELPPCSIIPMEDSEQVERVHLSFDSTFCLVNGSIFSCGVMTGRHTPAFEEGNQSEISALESAMRPLLADLVSHYLSHGGTLPLLGGNTGCNVLSQAKQFEYELSDKIHKGELEVTEVMGDPRFTSLKEKYVTLKKLTEDRQKLEQRIEESRSKMRPIHFQDREDDHSTKIAKFACGSQFLVALTTDGKLFFLGCFEIVGGSVGFGFARNVDGTVSIGAETKVPVLIPLPDDISAEPIEVFAGPSYYYVVLDDGTVLSAGIGDCHQLIRDVHVRFYDNRPSFTDNNVRRSLLPGVCDFPWKSSRQRSKEMSGYRPEIFAGGARHVLTVWGKGTGDKRETRLYGVGDNRMGQLGLGKRATLVKSLTPVPFFGEQKPPIIGVACGCEHSVVLVAGGAVFVFGSNAGCQLGMKIESPDYCVFDPITPPALCGTKVTQIRAGLDSTHAISESVVYACGSGLAVTGSEDHEPSDGIVEVDFNKFIDGYKVRRVEDFAAWFEHSTAIVEVEVERTESHEDSQTSSASPTLG